MVNKRPSLLLGSRALIPERGKKEPLLFWNKLLLRTFFSHYFFPREMEDLGLSGCALCVIKKDKVEEIWFEKA